MPNVNNPGIGIVIPDEVSASAETFIADMVSNYSSTTGVLAVVSGIDLKTTAQTTLYTVPTAKSCFITHIFLEITATSGFAVAAAARVGLAAAYTEYCAAVILTGLSAVGNFTDLANATLIPIHKKFAAADVLKLDVTVGATATTLTGKVTVVGTLV